MNENEEIEKVILLLGELHSLTDNHSSIYDGFSPGGLQKKLAEIQESINFMRSMESF